VKEWLDRYSPGETPRPRPNDRPLGFFCAAPSAIGAMDYWRFIVFYPDYDPVPSGGYVDVSEPLGWSLTPPVLPHPCYWEMTGEALLRINPKTGRNALGNTI
jgi:hypothetical protein